MPRALFLSLFTAILALLLAAFCFLQVAAHKESTEQSLSIIERQFVNRSSLGSEQAARLDHALANLRWNDRSLKLTRSNLWLSGVFGFVTLATLNFLLAFFLNVKIRAEASKATERES
jgi:hypothetical protein